MNDAPAMPLRLSRLLLWFFLGYFLLFRLRELTLTSSLAEELRTFSDPHLLTLEITAVLAFASYTFGQYLLFYFGFRRLRWYALAALEIALVVVCVLFRALLEEGIVRALTGIGNYNPGMSWTNYFLDNIYYAIIFSAIGVVFYFYQFARHNDRARQRSELLRREAEVKFLRSQVNPHFLFNTLNNLYSLVNANSPHALPVLEKLSGLLRYSLYEQERTVPLDKELDYLQDLLELERLRQPGVVPPELTIGPFTRAWSLPPLLLVPFVENACKHGDLTRPEQPLTVRITETESGLFVRFTNPVRTGVNSTDGVGGIGLENVRKRLKLLYPGRHTFRAEKRDGVFVVEMTLGDDARPGDQLRRARGSSPASTTMPPFAKSGPSLAGLTRVATNQPTTNSQP